MKKTKLIIPALGLLLLSTAASVSSTVAWFAVNGTVQANGMAVTAKTDNAYLIISAGTTLSGNATTATASLNAQLKPVKPMGSLTSTNIETITSWGTASSTDPADANSDATLTALSSGDLLGTGNYVAKQSFMVGLLANSAPAANPLRLSAVTLSNANAGITVVVVCGTNVYSHNATAASIAGENLAAANLVTTDGVQVDAYIYIDGSSEYVYTNNAAELNGNVSLSFSI